MHWTFKSRIVCKNHLKTPKVTLIFIYTKNVLINSSFIKVAAILLFEMLYNGVMFVYISDGLSWNPISLGVDI